MKIGSFIISLMILENVIKIVSMQENDIKKMLWQEMPMWLKMLSFTTIKYNFLYKKRPV